MLDPAERVSLANQLRAGRDTLLDAVAGVSETQGKFQPGPDQWSIEGVIEHLTVTEHGMFRLIAAHYEPLETPWNREREAKFTTFVVDRAEKWDAPILGGNIVPVLSTVWGA